jgi:hypothetical protein
MCVCNIIKLIPISSGASFFFAHSHLQKACPRSRVHAHACMITLTYKHIPIHGLSRHLVHSDKTRMCLARMFVLLLRTKAALVFGLRHTKIRLRGWWMPDKHWLFKRPGKMSAHDANPEEGETKTYRLILRPSLLTICIKASLMAAPLLRQMSDWNAVRKWKGSFEQTI